MKRLLNRYASITMHDKATAWQSDMASIPNRYFADNDRKDTPAFLNDVNAIFLLNHQAYKP